MEAILACTFEKWQPGIGDASWRGWATVVLYLAVAGLALILARRAPFPSRSHLRERVFWGAITVLMLALAVNKQLDRILGMRGGIPALGVTGNMLFEWTGPLLVGGGALWVLRRGRVGRKRGRSGCSPGHGRTPPAATRSAPPDGGSVNIPS